MHAEMDPYPFPVPGYRFDQRNEMFKRRTWDEEFVPHGKRLYTQVKYDDQALNEHTSPGMLKWPVHAMKCLDWWVKNGTHCSVCIRVCPWTKPNNLLHKTVRLLAERNILIRLIVKADQMLGYGKQTKDLAWLQDPAVVQIAEDSETVPHQADPPPGDLAFKSSGKWP